MPFVVPKRKKKKEKGQGERNSLSRSILPGWLVLHCCVFLLFVVVKAAKEINPEKKATCMSICPGLLVNAFQIPAPDPAMIEGDEKVSL